MAVVVLVPLIVAHEHDQRGADKELFCTLLRDLVAGVPTPEQKRGRPSLPLADLLFSAAFKVYSTVSARRFMTDLRDASASGMIGKTPHFNSIFNVLDREDVTPILTELITRAAMPLHALETAFAVDSTGIGTQCFYRHYEAKYGKPSATREFLKLHAIIGTKTNVITAAEVTDRFTGDVRMLPALVEKTAANFNVQQVAADKAYSSRENLMAIEAVGAVPYVPFKHNTRTNNQSQTWNRLFHFFSFHRDEFLTKYHTRSNAESTFSALKRKFGDMVRSKTPVAQRNEALLKVLCHNIVCVIHEMHESGVSAIFPTTVAAACTKTYPAAQQVLDLE